MSLYGALAEADRDGKEVIAGSGDLDNNGQLEVETPFANVDAVVANVESSSAPDAVSLTWSVSGATVTLHGWTSAPAASTANETVSYTIIGRRR